MKRFTLFIALLTCVLAGRAQDACYLLGTDGIMEANHASATLEKQKEGVFAAEVTFYAEEFTIATKLGTTADGWKEITSYRWGANDEEVWVDKDKQLLRYTKYRNNLRFVDCKIGYTYWVKVTFEGDASAYIQIYNSKNDDPGFNDPDYGAPDNGDDDITEVPDIDLTTGAHFTVTVHEPGSLKQRLENVVNQTDEDLVDFLTVKGQMGSEDLKYLIAQKGLVSQLQYLDLSDVELVYDDQAYYTTGASNGVGNGSSETICYLSAENREDHGSGMSGFQTVIYHHYWSNDLAYAFSNMKNLRQIKLPKTLKGVGAHILDGTPIEKVTLPTTPKHIGEYAFHLSSFDYEGGCKLKAFDLPESVDSLAAYALEGIKFRTIDVGRISKMGEGCLCNTNVSEATLHSSLKRIPAKAFSGCSKLTSVTVPGSVESIGETAFSGCEKLATVTMGDKVKKIGAEAFSGCSRLEDVTISPNIEELGKNAFASVYYNGTVQSDIPWVAKLPNEGGVLYISKVAYKHLNGTDLNIKEGTVSLAESFINTNEGINSITLPSTLRILGKECLKNAAFTSIDLPENVEKIGTDAFAYCTKLRRATIPANVKYIGEGAFYNTGLIRVYYNAVDAEVQGSLPQSLTRAIIGEGVRTIPAGVFSECNNLTRVQMPSTVESIGEYAFNGCTSLSHIDLPSSLKEIGNYAFKGCALQSVTSYMKEPFVLGKASVEECESQRLGWIDENGNITWFESTGGNVVWDPNAGYKWLPYYYVSVSSNTPFGDFSYAYERGNTEDEAANKKAAVPLLKVPNGTLDAYLADPSWAVTFYTIEQFDGASSTEAVEETTSVTVSNEVTEDTDLSSTMLGNIFVTLDTEDSGDGYNVSEGCLVINSTVSDEQLAAATADDADDLTVKNHFNGLIFEVPAGKGSVIIDCQTLGQQAVYVKIGSSDARQLNAANRQQLSIPYDVVETTRIYVYAAKGSAPVASQSVRAAYPNDNAVKLYGLTINVDENLDAISTVTADQPANQPRYNLAGQRVPANYKGIVIQNGQKHLVK